VPQIDNLHAWLEKILIRWSTVGFRDVQLRVRDVPKHTNAREFSGYQMARTPCYAAA
jgi:hypothetical protein